MLNYTFGVVLIKLIFCKYVCKLILKYKSKKLIEI